MMSRRAVPRAALLALLVAIVSHCAAVLVALTSPQPVPAWQWGTMLCSDSIMVAVVLSRAQWFFTRNFRLPGVFVVSTYLIILTPLPATVRRYKAFVPSQTVLSISAGLAVLAIVIFVLTGRPITARSTPSGPSDAIVSWFIIICAVVLLPIWIRSIGSVPLFDLFGGTDPLKAASARDEALNSLSNGALRAAVGSLRNLYLMFATGYLVSRTATIGREEWRRLTHWRVAAGGVLIIAAIYALLTTERAILGELVIVALVAWLMSRRRVLTIRHIAVSSAVGIAFPVIYGALVSTGGIAAALTGLRRRIVYLPDDVMIHYFIAFPRYHGFLDGAAIPKWGRLTGTPTFDLSSFIYDKYYKVDASLTGIANGSFFGVGWANWGMFGVIIFSAAVAVALILVERWLRGIASPTSAALRGVAVVQTALLTSSDINRSLLGFLPGFLDIVVILVVVARVDQRFGRRTSETRGVARGRRPTADAEAGPDRVRAR